MRNRGVFTVWTVLALLALFIHKADLVSCKDTLWLLRDGGRPYTHRPQTSDIQRRAGHEPVCFVPRPRPACALLEFTQASAHILRVSHSTDIGITTVISWT